MDIQRKQAPYLFYGQTQSLCEECLSLVPTKILLEGNDVFYQKRCAEHGVQKTRISSDVDYFKLCKEYIKPGDRPLKFQSKTQHGCPYDCGLCPDHEQHSCVALIEINDVCNLQCPVCFASSSPGNAWQASLDEVESMLDTLVESEGEPDVLQISGGEPSIHPQILDILRLAKSKPVRHLMLNTNGLRLAQDEAFVAALSEFKPGFEVYLQFDSLDKSALINIRGADLRKQHERALKNLERHNISTTLVVTVKKGVNDKEIGEIIDYALQFRCVRGITYQPVQDTGRNEGFDKNHDRFLLSDIRNAIYQQSSHFESKDLIPLPCNPESIAIAYALRDGDKLLPVTDLFPREELIEAVPNAITFEKDSVLREKVIELFSLSSCELNTAERMGSLLCCLPKVPALDTLSYENIFRITIVQFLDRYNFCVGNVKRACIHFVTADQRIIPFDTYNLMYRNGLDDKLRRKNT
jgi:7,8-dihydro-6-hydroxymethylpterin dimethyltransferase